ncbi:cytochrome c oxidase polypeptide I / cytochrome c oxidase polypeptide III [Limimaricola cinnabarinus LL-001]|uniref:Cytochrome c oxidase polypeptide I / cytochrome c oxidase polypeptide III n=1 Tax=Limimaricola cinnabarinus LL-001 TaxID=1337093 RepID=U3AL14_9RHOB|nr:cytochrome c oxidase polypeptide I / cytochrome c oxidase polypeptide III [Limimaricola cinnabarinus LL-001]
MALATAAFAASWALTRGARSLNRAGRVGLARGALALAPVLTLAGMGGFVLSVMDLDPTAHVYPAMMWALMVWVVAHGLLATIMQLYCLAGSLFGKLTPRYDADLWNVTLFWHFMGLTALVTGAMMGLVPRLM